MENQCGSGHGCSVCHCNPCKCNEGHCCGDKKDQHHQWKQSLISFRKMMLNAMNEDDDDKRDMQIKEALKKEIEYYESFLNK